VGFDSDTGPGCGLAGSWLRCWVCVVLKGFLGDGERSGRVEERESFEEQNHRE